MISPLQGEISKQVYNVIILLMTSHYYKQLMFWRIFLVYLALLSLATAIQLQTDQLLLIEKVKKTLGNNFLEGERWGMKYHFYRPGLYKYGPNQWLWDSCFHMIAWSRLNVTNSILDLRTMLQKQDPKTGRIPEMIYWGNQSKRDGMMNKFFHTDPSQTDITQMPMTPIALRRIYEQTNKDPQILKQFLQKLVHYHDWWANQRQPQGDGLVVIIHPWQSGLDASPMYDQALKVFSDQPGLKEMYSRFIELQLSYKNIYKWNQTKIVEKKKHKANKVFLDYFVIKEVGVNAVYTYGWKILADLSREWGNQRLFQHCTKQYLHFLQGLLTLYDNQKQRYVSHYLDGSEYKPSQKNTVQSLFPLLVPGLPQQHRQNILNMLRDENHYKADFPIPTVSRSDPAYNPVYSINLMWRGPSWAAPNYFILEALLNLKEYELYQQIAEKWVRMVLERDIWQMWNPQTGQGYGVKQLGMSTSVIDVMFKLQEVKVR